MDLPIPPWDVINYGDGITGWPPEILNPVYHFNREGTIDYLDLNGIRAWICMDGSPLPVFQMKMSSKQEDTIMCWIPSMPGKRFAVHWQDNQPRNTAAYIQFDGRITVPGRFLQNGGVASREGVRSAGQAEQPFVFMEGEGSYESFNDQFEDDDWSQSITLKVKYALVKSRLHPGTRDANAYAPMEVMTDVLRKDGGFHIGFDNEELVPPQHPQTFDIRKVKSFATFVFRYRPYAHLIHLGIVPRIPYGLLETRIGPGSSRYIPDLEEARQHLTDSQKHDKTLHWVNSHRKVDFEVMSPPRSVSSMDSRTPTPSLSISRRHTPTPSPKMASGSAKKPQKLGWMTPEDPSSYQRNYDQQRYPGQGTIDFGQ